MKPLGMAWRAVEVAMALILATVAVPFLLLSAAVSFAHYRTWPFFVHDRVGRGGRVFRLVKIRTLPPSIDPYADKYEISQYRLPRLMAMLRRFHVDEFPQLVHVLTGRMALVGPRPEMPDLHASLPEKFGRQRTSVRPGLTCLWQISPHNAGLIGERPEYDRLYVEHRTLRLDLWILARTVANMTTGRATHLREVPGWVTGASLESSPRAEVPVASSSG